MTDKKEKKEPKAKKRTGRPFREFDQKLFENLCKVQCTVRELEAVFNSDIKTFQGWCLRTYDQSFSDVYKRFSDGGKPSLRRAQYNLAMKNASMGIWLGKQWLGQRDIPQEMEEFNGKLGTLLDMITQLKSEREFANVSGSKEG